jgi:hypothetical protein
MLKLTNKEKIKKLRKLMWLNFKNNFFYRLIGDRVYVTGLCQLYKCLDLSGEINISLLNEYIDLKEEIPEIIEFVNRKYILHDSLMYGYWFSTKGINAFSERHWAIVRTIWKLKKKNHERINQSSSTLWRG